MLSRTAPRSRGTPATRSTTAAAALCTMKNHICRADPPSDRPPHCQGACTVVPIDLRSCPAPAMAPSPSATSTRSGSRLRALLDYTYCCCCHSYNLDSSELFASGAATCTAAAVAPTTSTRSSSSRLVVRRYMYMYYHYSDHGFPRCCFHSYNPDSSSPALSSCSRQEPPLPLLRPWLRCPTRRGWEGALCRKWIPGYLGYWYPAVLACFGLGVRSFCVKNHPLASPFVLGRLAVRRPPLGRQPTPAHSVRQLRDN